MRKTLLHFLLIVVIGVIVYSNTLNTLFIWDDNWLIVKNSNIRHLSNFTDCSGTRYLTYLSFAVNYKLNGLNVTGYHIFNIAVHLLNAILIYLLISIIFRTPYFIPPFNSPLTNGGVVGGVPLSKGGYTGVALFSGLIFVSHPVYTQAVTNINQRSILLATFFYLLSLVAYIKWRLITMQQSNSTVDQQVKKKNYCSTALLLYCASLISAIFAMKCKEVSITLPIVIFLFERFFFRDKWKRSIIYIIPILLTLIIIPLSKPQADVFNRPRVDTFKIEDGSILSGLEATKLSDIPRKEYMLTGFRVMLTYMRLFFLPFNLNFDYDFPIYKSFFESNVILSSLFILFLLALAIYFYHSSSSNSQPSTLNSQLLSFGIFWFFITLSIESFVVVLNYVIFEYRLYLPSIGILLLFAELSGYVITLFKEKIRYISGAVILIVIIFLSATYARNKILKDEITLWENDVKKSPYKAAVHLNLGNAYYNQARTEKAIQEFRTALVIDPYYVEAYNNLGVAYYKQGELSKAIRKFKTALSLKYYYPATHFRLARVYQDQRQINKAIEEYKIALMLNPEDAIAHYNLGNVYFDQRRLNDAIKEYQTALRLRPDFVDAHYSLGLLYHSQRQLNEAIQEYKIALELKPNSTETHNNLGNVYLSLGLIDTAITHYKAALQLDSNSAQIYYNLGLAYKRKGLINESIQEFQAALKIKPNFVQASKNLKSLQRIKNR